MTQEPIANWTNEDNVFVPRRPSWFKFARCRGVSSDLFFEEGVKRLVIEGKSYCYRCPVRVDCLEHAIDHDEIGLWGGMTTSERRKEIRRRVRQQRGQSKQTQRLPSGAAGGEVVAHLRMVQRGAHEGGMVG